MFSNEDVFEGTFVNGTIEGEGKLKCANGLVYDGKWEGSLVSERVAGEWEGLLWMGGVYVNGGWLLYC